MTFETPTAQPPSTYPRERDARINARRLGWFSIGLGLAEVLMPRQVARATGLDGLEGWLRLQGLREIAAGIGILRADPQQQAKWLWARVAGDTLDLATLGLAVGRGGPAAAKAGVAMLSVAAVSAADVACAQALGRAEKARTAPRYDYRHRRGLPLPAEEMRGAARADFDPPIDMITPEALRPYVVH